MSVISDKVKNKIASILGGDYSDIDVKIVVDKILAIRGLAIVDRRAFLTKDTRVSPQQAYNLYKAGWVKEVKD